MKYNGNTLALETREIELPRVTGPIRLRVSAVSVGVRRDYDALYPKPNVPLIITDGKNGRKQEENWHDPAFRKALEEREYLQNIYIVYRVIAGDPNLSFDNKPDTIDGLRAVAKELAESGFSEGDLLIILKEALRASNLSQDEIEKAKAGF
jgi:hypothetical protein